MAPTNNPYFSPTGWKWSTAIVPLILWVAVLGGITLGLVRMMEQKWPGLHYDSVLYSTVVVNRAAGYGNTFDVYTEALVKTPSRAFVQHGQLYPGLVSTLFDTKNYDSLFRAIYLLNIVTTILFAVCLFYIAGQILQMGPWETVIVSLVGALATLAVLLQIQGRPEHIVPLIVIVGEITATQCRGINVRMLVRGIELGAVGAASPAAGVVLGFAFLVYIFAEFELKSALRYGPILLFAAAAIWALLTRAFYSGSLWDLVLSASQGDIDRRALRENVAVWLANPQTPFMAMPFVILVAFWGWRLWQRKGCFPAWKWGLLVLLLLNLTYWVYRTGVKNPPTNYRLLALFPGVVLGALWLLKDRSHALSGMAVQRVTKRAGWVLILALAVVSLGGVRAGAFLFLNRQQATSFSEAKQRYDALKAGLRDNERVGIDPWSRTTLVVLDGPPWRMLTLPPGSDPVEVEQRLGCRFNYYLLTQDGRTEAPEELKGFQLKESWFMPPETGIAKALFGGHASGYQFAVYERKPHG